MGSTRVKIKIGDFACFDTMRGIITEIHGRMITFKDDKSGRFFSVSRKDIKRIPYRKRK